MYVKSAPVYKIEVQIYIGGLTFSIVMMAIIGIYEVVSQGQQL